MLIRTTITKTEFEKLTWMSFGSVATDINDITVSRSGNMVSISVLGYELKTMSVESYNSTLKAN